jgi:hypothetical protein
MIIISLDELAFDPMDESLISGSEVRLPFQFSVNWRFASAAAQSGLPYYAGNSVALGTANLTGSLMAILVSEKLVTIKGGHYRSY